MDDFAGKNWKKLPESIIISCRNRENTSNCGHSRHGPDVPRLCASMKVCSHVGHTKFWKIWTLSVSNNTWAFYTFSSRELQVIHYKFLIVSYEVLRKIVGRAQKGRAQFTMIHDFVEGAEFWKRLPEIRSLNLEDKLERNSISNLPLPVFSATTYGIATRRRNGIRIGNMTKRIHARAWPLENGEWSRVSPIPQLPSEKSI